MFANYCNLPAGSARGDVVNRDAGKPKNYHILQVSQIEFTFKSSSYKILKYNFWEVPTLSAFARCIRFRWSTQSYLEWKLIKEPLAESKDDTKASST